jgi:poly(3-hydroxybutyrate) depolymerase
MAQANQSLLQNRSQIMFLKFVFVISVGLSLNAQTINLRGKISNKSGEPVSNAVINLVSQGLKDTTGADGIFAITKAASAVLPLLKPQNNAIHMKNGFLVFSISKQSSVLIDVYDIGGNLLKKESMNSVEGGFYKLDIAGNFPASKLLIVKASIDGDESVFRCVPLQNGNSTLNQFDRNTFLTNVSKMASMTAVNDTLKISASGFQTKTVAISSYENQSQNITLEAVSGNEKNPPCPSGGCGKDLSDLKSGTYTITSAGLSRKYTIKIPANYDKNTPYRLIFGMHMMGGSMSTVTDSKYYELETYAANAKVPVIFVAPDGYSDDTPWRVKDNKDHTFFADMLKLFKEKLCVDTSRIFCCGFSYGAMISYSLSLGFPDQLRAVATYAPANWNIWLPANPKKPIAYFQTTGTTDNLCTWVNNDSRKEGGKYCVLQHIEDNGCPAPSTIPLATEAGKHVSTEFSGCKPGYPVVFGSFVVPKNAMGHAMSDKDQGSSANWIAKETWDFFMRF